MTSHDDRVNDPSRRRFVKAAAYTAPVILTLKAEPAFASYGSGAPGGPTGDPGPPSQHRHAVLRSLFGRQQASTVRQSTPWLRRLFERLGRTSS
jgi:hypothetical protein